MWASATSWELDTTPDSVPFTVLHTSTQALDELAAIRRKEIDGEEPSQDFSLLPAKELLIRFKDLKFKAANLLKNIENAEDKEKQMLEKLNTFKKILDDIKLTDDDTHHMIKKVNEKVRLFVEDLKISHMKNEYEQCRKALALIHELVRDSNIITGGEAINHTCPICFNEPPMYVNTPCGHVICGTCRDRVRNRVCHLCRTNVHATIKLFL